MCRVGTDASTLITSQRANFPVMEETPTQLGPDGCQGTSTHHKQSHASRAQTRAKIYSNIFLVRQMSSELIWEMEFSGTCDEEEKKIGSIMKIITSVVILTRGVSVKGWKRQPLTVGQSKKSQKTSVKVKAE